MSDHAVTHSESSTRAGRGLAGFGTLASGSALFSAAACCVLPLAFAAVGLGAGGLAAVVPWRWPLTIVAALALAAGWFLTLRKRAIASGTECVAAAPPRANVILLCFATLMTALSASWGLFEQPLMRLLGGA